MKRLALAALILAAATTASAQTARIRFDALPDLSAHAKETTDVTLDGPSLRLASKFLSSSDSDQRAARDIVQKLEGIYVRSYEFETAGEYDANVLDKVRTQLGPDWKRIVTVRGKEENSEVYMFTKGDQVQGLVVLAAEPRELTIVNLVGPIDPEQLSKIEGQFGIPHTAKK